MGEAELPRVQHLARKFLRRLGSVNFVAEHRMTEMMQMHSDLVGATGVQFAFD